MPTTAFDDIAASAHVSDGDLSALLVQARRRTHRRRAGQAAAIGGGAVLATAVVAAGAFTAGDRATPAATPNAVLDPFAIATVGGASGSNLVGDCQGDYGATTRPEYEAKQGTYSILIGVYDCAIASVAGADLIEATTSLRTTTLGDEPTVWIRTTVTNVADETLAFDLASPTVQITVPEDSHWFHETMTAARPLQADESWREHPGIESWGGSSAPRGGVGQVVTPRLDGPPTPGVAWNLVLQRPQDDGLDLATSRGTVTLEPGHSFVFESGLNVPAISASDEHAAEEMVALFSNPAQLTASVYIALQADSLGGAQRTVLIDSAVPLTREP